MAQPQGQALPQPDFTVISNNMTELGQQFALCGNIPAVAGADAITASLATINATLVTLNDSMRRLEDAQIWLPGYGIVGQWIRKIPFSRFTLYIQTRLFRTSHEREKSLTPYQRIEWMKFYAGWNCHIKDYHRLTNLSS
ncbi:hypothetical protein F4679DRAFT_580257 [Xylaria curta]|nr:hypothetical protein F4679DRAFT_580257 [Xylaria curta]